MKKINKKVIEAIEYIKQNPTVSMTQAGQIFNMDRHIISKYLKNDDYLKYNIENQSNIDDEYLYYFSKDELEYINFYLSNNDDVKRYGAIIAKQKGYSIDSYVILKINLNYGEKNKFNTISTEEDAYWLGFITADGSIIENKWLQIQLAEKDKEHLIKFCYYMGLDKKETSEIIKNGFGGAYTRDNPIVNVKICSLNIINNLKDKGITPKKSGKEKPYICSSKQLEKAYIRGLIDGDGFIGSTQKRFGIVGSYEICSYVKDFINKNIKDISNNTIREHGVIYKLEVTGSQQTAIILKELYDNAHIYLDRKYQLYIDQYKN